MRISRPLGFLVGGAVTVALAIASPAAAGGSDDDDDRPGHPHAENGLIAFHSEASGRPQLYTVRPDGTHLEQITHVPDPYNAIAPDWSPDGRRIVFELGDESFVRVAVVDADGGNLEVLQGLFPEGGSSAQPSFSPDGREIFYERWDGVSLDAIFRVRLGGGVPRQVTFPPAGYVDSNAAVAPDGRTMSFVRIGDTEQGEAALFTIDLRTGSETQLTPYTFNVAVKQGWSPDGRRIAFTRDYYHPMPGVSGNVMTIRADGRHLRAVTDYSGGEMHGTVGTYSPDGRWLVYRETGPGGTPLMIVHPNGRGAHAILSVPGLVPRFIDWGPRVR